VADAFEEVQRADQDKQRLVEEANQYANQKLGGARGQAAQVREEAAAYKDRVRQGSGRRGAALRFGLQASTSRARCHADTPVP